MEFDMEKDLSKKNSRLGLLVILFVVLVLIFSLGGELVGWMKDSFCLQYLGCVYGFFGYDAVAHFVSGMAEAIILFWLMKKFVRFNVLGESRWKNVVVLVALVALIGVLWEFGEFTADYIRMNGMHINLRALDMLAQPSNSDTMGDLFFDMLGGFIVAIFAV